MVRNAKTGNNQATNSGKCPGGKGRQALEGTESDSARERANCPHCGKKGW